MGAITASISLTVVVFLLDSFKFTIATSSNTQITECEHKNASLLLRCADDAETDLTPLLQSSDPSDMRCHKHSLDIDQIQRLSIELCAWPTLPDQLLRHFRNLTHLQLSMLALEAVRSADWPAMAKRSVTEFHQITVDISRNNIQRIEGHTFHRLNTVTVLDFSHNRLHHLPAAAFAGLAELEVLDLGFNAIDDVPGRMFHGLAHLKKVILARNRIKTLGAELFDPNNRLIVLNVSRNRITELYRRSLLHLGRLEYLDVSQCQVAFVEPKAFAPLRNLKYLDLSQNRLTRIDLDVFACAADRLHTLLLSDNQLTAFDGHADWDALPRLSLLRIDDNLFECAYLRRVFAAAPANVRDASRLYGTNGGADAGRINCIGRGA